MKQKTVMNLFSHQNKPFALLVIGCILLLSVIALSVGGCQRNNAGTAMTWGKTKDVTEDLYHRLRAGIFEIGKDPLICELIPQRVWRLGIPFKHRTGSNETLRITWERGSFWVQSDDHALVVVYLDEETVFNHIEVTPTAGFHTLFQFRESVEVPVRDPLRAMFGM